MGSIALAASLVAYNAIANRFRAFHSWAYLPANLTLVAAVGAIGVWGFGLDRAELGLRWSRWWVGAALGGSVAVPLAGLLALERGRALLRDQRLAGVRGALAAYTVAVRIPIGTAFVEEAVFRGVLLGSWLHAGTVAAIAWSSLAFGLWHVVPAALLARANRLSAFAVVPAGVVATAGAGAFLAWLRIETGSLAAPILTHGLVNSLAAAASLVALRVRGDVAASDD